MDTPNNWIVVKIKNQKEVIYKLFATWHGSYLEGPAWQINSGIESYKETKDYYDFYGYSGSVYRCYKNLEGFSGYGTAVFNNLQKSVKLAKMFPIKMQTYRKKFNATA